MHDGDNAKESSYFLLRLGNAMVYARLYYRVNGISNYVDCTYTEADFPVPQAGKK